MPSADSRVSIHVSRPMSPTCWLVNDLPAPWSDRTSAKETTYQISCSFPLCAKSDILWLSDWSMLFKPGHFTEFSRRNLPGSPEGVCRAERVCWGRGSLQDSFPTEGDTRGRAPQMQVTLQSCLKCCLSHILPFFRLAAIIFFFCKIVCKQQQKSYYKKRGKRRLAFWSGHPSSPHPVSTPPHAADTSRCKRPFCTEIYFLWRICKIIKYAVIFWLM